ncbi:hypothetical protein F4780DRAFT_126680 [Xylariomycetidae sp. FL0641]|nr:hypothetical protein F4780DRAFT_126680 [Xylariomycetidae sp. FL0641]
MATFPYHSDFIFRRPQPSTSDPDGTDEYDYKWGFINQPPVQVMAGKPFDRPIILWREHKEGRPRHHIRLRFVRADGTDRDLIQSELQAVFFPSSCHIPFLRLAHEDVNHTDSTPRNTKDFDFAIFRRGDLNIYLHDAYYDVQKPYKLFADFPDRPDKYIYALKPITVYRENSVSKAPSAQVPRLERERIEIAGMAYGYDWKKNSLIHNVYPSLDMVCPDKAGLDKSLDEFITKLLKAEMRRG